MKAVVIALLFAIALTGSVGAQSPPTQAKHPGVVLFEQGKFADAITSLESATKSKEHKADAELWNYLGLAYLANGESKKSKKAFDKAVGLNPGNAIFHANLAFAYLTNQDVKKAYESAEKAIRLNPMGATGYQVRGVANLRSNKLDPAEQDADTFITLDPGNAGGYLLKSEVLIAKFATRINAGNKAKDEVGFLNRATGALEQGLAKSKGSPLYSDLEAELASISAFRTYFSRDDKPITADTAPQAPQPGVTPYRIFAKPRASYTDAARSSGVQGTIRVAVLLGASGKVESVMFLKRLGYGLEREVLKAARAIRFDPKMVNGKPVPVVVTVEYGFSIY